MDKLGELLAFIRKQKGMSQKELADKLGVSSSTISKWESGRSSPDLLSLSKISNLFQISGDDLLNPTETLNHLQNPANIVATISSEEDSLNESSTKNRNRTIVILSLVVLLLILIIIIYCFFPKTAQNINANDVPITYFQSRHNVVTDYGAAYEMAYLTDSPIDNETRVAHANKIYSNWLSGEYGNFTEKVLIVNYYDNLTDAEQWEFTEKEVYFFNFEN